MKKMGFTLSEILVVLGIIGVVAALTLPSLMSDTASAQIGPKLAKSVAMFDQASAAMLNELGVDSVYDSDIDSESKYIEHLTNHLKASSTGTHAVSGGGGAGACIGLKGSFASGKGIKSKDGVVYSLNFDSTKDESDKPAHKKFLGTVYIDINGDSQPNIAGTDVFAFSWWADGSLRPAGADTVDGASGGSGCTYKGLCPLPNANGEYQKVSDYWACAGHIFENNLKVQYE